LRPDDQVTDVVLAGMGGRLIVEILEEGRRFLPQIKRLVLQPNVGQHLVRKWLFENGWRLLDEAILKEAGRIYEVMSAEPGVETRYPPDADEREWLFRLGPVLLNKKPPLLREKWIKESAKWKRMAQNMALSEDPEVKQKRHQLLEEIQSLEGRLICMQKDRP
jgi:tRNA (adenine22-N1)-methyltransferase